MGVGRGERTGALVGVGVGAPRPVLKSQRGSGHWCASSVGPRCMPRFALCTSMDDDSIQRSHDGRVLVGEAALKWLQGDAFFRSRGMGRAVLWVAVVG